MTIEERVLYKMCMDKEASEDVKDAIKLTIQEMNKRIDRKLSTLEIDSQKLKRGMETLDQGTQVWELAYNKINEIKGAIQELKSLKGE